LDLELPLTRARRAVILLRWSGSGGLRGVLAANQMYEVTQKRLVRSFLKKHLIFSFTFTYMHKLKHVRDTFKVLQLFFHPNHCILATFLTTNLTIKNLHSYPQCACETMNRFSTAASSRQKKYSKIMHKQPLTYQRESRVLTYA